MSIKRQALVTGANKGIGLAIARGLAQAGMSVWMGARDRSRGEASIRKLLEEGLDVRLLDLDVADESSVWRAAEIVARETDVLHALVNNAGIIIDPTTAPSKVRMEDAKATYEVNVFGPIGVTQAFIPLLMAAKDARVVMMSSGVPFIRALISWRTPRQRSRLTLSQSRLRRSCRAWWRQTNCWKQPTTWRSALPPTRPMRCA